MTYIEPECPNCGGPLGGCLGIQTIEAITTCAALMILARVVGLLL